jgi:group I intron endonuclease
MNLKDKSKQYPSTSGIYKITSPDNKIYIGQAVNFQQRYYYYLTAPFKDQPRIKESFDKFKGIENHKFEIIEECSIKLLDKRELYWGNHFNVLGEYGLNCRLGHGKGKLRESTKQKISKALTGKKQSSETIEKRRLKLTGQKRTKESCKLMSEKKIGFKITWGDKIKESKKLNPYKPSFKHIGNIKKSLNKSIIQYDLKGNMIKEYESATMAMKITGIKNDNICCCLKEKSKSAGGFVWKYKI